MSRFALVGIILIVIGLDVGPLKVEATKEKTVPLPPVLGGVAVAAGVLLVIVGSRRG